MNIRDKLRIAWLMPGSGFDRPGAARYWEPILKAFQTYFPQTTIVSTGKIDPYYTERLNICAPGNIYMLNSHPSRAMYSKSIPWITPQMLFYLFKNHFDIIITMEFTIATLYAVIIRSLMKTKIILLKEGRHPVNNLLRYFYRMYLSSQVDIFLANTPSAQEYLQEDLHVPLKKIYCHPYLVPPPPIISSSGISHSHSPRPIFLCVGQLIPRKGILHLLEAAAILKRRGKTFSLWIVGDGPQREELTSKAESLNLSQSVHFFGSVPYEQMGSFYTACDVFVLPTLSDYRSVAVMEAVSYGKPILDSIYDGGACEFVLPDENGFIFDPRAPNALEELMIKFVINPMLITQYGHKSKEISTRYTISNSLDALAQAVERCFKV